MSRKTGLWLIGAGGGVATTVAVGLSAIQQQLTDQVGLVSSRPEFKNLEFTSWQNVVLGGHEIRQVDIAEEARALTDGPNPVIQGGIVASVAADLERYSTHIRPGTAIHCGSAIEQIAEREFVLSADHCEEAIQKIKADLQAFQNDHDLCQVVVVNLASTEPGFDMDSVCDNWLDLSTQLDDVNCLLPSSCCYAIAAIELKMPYINFTPSTGSSLPAICELAENNETCHMGQDGKTGETFMKSVLAPAFAKRNLKVLSWVGHNIFGNLDGQILNDPVNKKTKVESKAKMLEHLLGYQPDSHISIEYIQSLGDWKTAWDHIHFQGFLGTNMTMQFTWQGCDSILAAPLVLDLFRFADLADRCGETGLLHSLSSFFKSPLGTTDHDFARQYESLVSWANQIQLADS